MTAPNMAAITASLERSLQNCSLNHNQSRGFSGERSPSSDDTPAAVTLMEEGQDRNSQISSSDTTLELNSHLSLPYHWEQCLDLKTGEIYYINWKNGMKVTEDPRITATTTTSTEEEEEEEEDELYSDEDEEEEEEERSYDSDESSSEYSSPLPSCSRQQQQNYTQQMKKKEEQVLVVAGCKGCLMYFMVPKQVEDCPKCNAQLLHFDRSDN